MMTSKVKDQVQEAATIFKGAGLTKRYQTRGHSFTLEPVDVTLKAGEITSVVGENGYGKTTLLSLVAGSLAKTGGRADYPFLREDGRRTAYEIKQKVVMLTQELPAWQGKLVDNLHFYAAIHGIKGKENEEWVAFILDTLGLNEYKDATWKQISGGFRTRFSLARGLIQRPNLLVLDEPLANLDVNTQLTFLEDLRDLVKSFVEPLAMMISSQHLHEIETITDKIIFLQEGKTVYNGLLSDFESGRQENTFELVCRQDEVKVKEALKSLEVLGIKRAGGNLIIRFPVRVEGEDVLKKLMKAGITIELFRDISRSTRKLFSVEK